MLLWGSVPRNVMQVVVYGGVLEFVGVAGECLEIAFRGGDKVGVVEE